MAPKSEKLIAAELKALSSVYKDLWQDLRDLHAKTKAAASASGDDKDALEQERRSQQELITKKYGEKYREQMDDFYKGPGKNSTLAEKSAWLNRNYLASVLSLSQDYAEDNQCENIRFLWKKKRNPGFIAKMIISRFAPGTLYLGSGNPLENPEADWDKYMEDDTNRAEEEYIADEITNAKKAIAARTGDAPLSLFDRDKDKLGLFMAKLENAKTFSNSDEYKVIISTLKRFSMQELVPEKGADKLSPEQNHAVKLITLKDMIDSYIAHKARDGVKKNVYHKLAAVEELNRFVTGQLSGLNIDKFDFGGKTYDPKEKAVLAPGGNYESVNKIHGRKANMDTQECADALDCMDRIIGQAQDPGQKKELKDIKKAFLVYPGASGPDRVDAEKEASVKNGEVNGKLREAARKALNDGEKLMSMSAEDYNLFKSASGEGHYEFQSYKEVIYNYAERHKLKNIGVKWGGEVVYWSMSRLEKAMKKEAESAAGLYQRRNKKGNRGDVSEEFDQLEECFDSIDHCVQKDLRQRATEIGKLFEKDLTDEELIKKWPEMQLDHACYERYTSSVPQFTTFVEKYKLLENRMKELAGPTKVKDTMSNSL